MSERDRVIGIFNQVLHLALLPHEAPERQQLSTWDSLNHIRLVMALEEEFSMRLTADEIRSISSVQDVLRLVDEKRC